MGVYIKNMEKPKECIECEFSCLWVNGSTHCMVDGEELFCDGIPQRHDCPLIEIVTCGECVHWYNDADCGMACEFTNMEQPSDGFCNWGERRTETLDERIKRGLKEWKEK